MTLHELIEKVGEETCINELVQLHRINYSEPGYILSTKIITQEYKKVFKILSQQTKITDKILKFKLCGEVYNVTIDGILLRDWVIINGLDSKDLISSTVDIPTTLSNINVLMEIIFEITYYSFPETVENPI